MTDSKIVYYIRPPRGMFFWLKERILPLHVQKITKRKLYATLNFKNGVSFDMDFINQDKGVCIFNAYEDAVLALGAEQ